MAGARLPEELERVARELYGLPPEEFTGARTEAVKQARAAGDKELARAVGGLRRPALAAWAVNLIVREREGLLEQVTSMGDALREAQAQLDGEALRELTRQRRRLVTAVTAEVGAVAASHRHPLSAGASRQVEETVQAALVDPQAAAAVRSGLLVAPLASTGVESLAEVLGIPLPEGRSGRAPGMADGVAAGEPARGAGDEAGRPVLSLVTEDEEAARRAAAERAAAAAKAARKSARAAAKARDKAVSARSKAQARLLQLEAAVEELRRQLAEAEVQAEEAASRLADKEAAVEAAVATAEATAREAEEAAREAAESAAARPS